jgi:hypothetical protein
MGITSFYGPGMVVDITKSITVMTHLLTSDNTTALSSMISSVPVLLPLARAASSRIGNFKDRPWC